MERKEQNGHPTYETWSVANWLGNDEGLYNQVQNLTRDGTRHLDAEAPQQDRLDALRDLSVALRQLAEHAVGEPQQDASMDDDLLLFSLDEVDWQSLAYDELEEAMKEQHGNDYKLDVSYEPLGANRYDDPAEIIHEALGGGYDGATVRHKVQQLVRHELARGPDATWSLGEREWKQTEHVRVADRLKEYVDDNLRQHVDSGLGSDLVGAQIRQEGQWRQIAAERLPEPAEPSPVEPPRSGPGADEGNGRRVGLEL
jgi:hypothetical protein